MKNQILTTNGILLVFHISFKKMCFDCEFLLKRLQLSFSMSIDQFHEIISEKKQTLL